MSTALRRLGVPADVSVAAAPGGLPAAVGGVVVEAVNEDWVVEDRWWTGRPLRRRYFEVVLEDGRNLTLFRELASTRWFVQRA